MYFNYPGGKPVKWDGRVVPYKLSSLYTTSQGKKIKENLNSLYYETNGCIRFVERTNQKNYLKISKTGTGCNSHLGKRYSTTDMSLDDDCLTEYVIKHEAIHALGFEHTHSRSDRDKYIQVILENVKKGQEYNFNKYDTFNELVPYDYFSIMHYNPYSFSANGKKTMVAKSYGYNNFGGYKLDKNDVQMIKKLYQCS